MCFAQAAAVGEVLGSVAPAAKWIGEKVSQHFDRQDAIVAARTEAEIATLKAKAEIAAYKVKADIEWDLKWADGAVSSWKDEALLILWSIPTIGLFIPGLRPYVIDGFEYLKSFNPDAPSMFMAGWAIIFAASFGIKQALSFMLPTRYASLVSAISNAQPDIPQDVMPEIQKAVSAKTASGKS